MSVKKLHMIRFRTSRVVTDNQRHLPYCMTFPSKADFSRDKNLQTTYKRCCCLMSLVVRLFWLSRRRWAKRITGPLTFTYCEASALTSHSFAQGISYLDPTISLITGLNRIYWKRQCVSISWLQWISDDTHAQTNFKENWNKLSTCSRVIGFVACFKLSSIPNFTIFLNSTPLAPIFSQFPYYFTIWPYILSTSNGLSKSTSMTLPLSYI